jgi:8-oxo-dGTP pyrophosphatase MutT (NUDIX family)
MNKIIIASGPVIVENNKVLLDIQGDDNFWKFCGGKVQENETLSQTAIRRAKEELGIDIKITNPKPYIFHTKKEAGDENSDVIVAHFLSSFSGNIAPGSEVLKYEWIDIEKLPNNLAPSILPALEHFGFIE